MSKRGAGEDARQAMGRELKRLRADITESKKLLDRSPLLSWDKSISKWESELRRAKADCERLQQMVAALASETVAHLDSASQTISEFSSQLLEHLDRLLSLQNDGVLEETEKDIARFLAGWGGYREHLSEAPLAKFRFYSAGFETTMAQVARLQSAPRPAVLEDSDDETSENLWLTTMRETRFAIDIAGNLSGKTPFTAVDAASLGSLFLDKVEALVSSIEAFSAASGHLSRRYVSMVCVSIQNKDFGSIIPTRFCSSCLEEIRGAAGCDNCNSAICQECFSRKLSGQSAQGWPEAASLARLHCDVCPTGFYDEALLRHLSDNSSKLYVEAVRADELTEASANAAKERTREFREMLAPTNADDILYRAVKPALVDMVTLRTPCSCRRPFVEIEACLAIECDSCHTFFCGLCIQGSWSRAEAHRHVETCRNRPPTMTDDYFMPLDAWKRHMAERQRRLVEEWLSQRDLSEVVKRRLLEEDFPPPKPLAA